MLRRRARPVPAVSRLWLRPSTTDLHPHGVVNGQLPTRTDTVPRDDCKCLTAAFPGREVLTGLGGAGAVGRRTGVRARGRGGRIGHGFPSFGKKWVEGISRLISAFSGDTK